MFDTTVLFVGIPGGLEIAVILLLAILLFGADRIPKLARSSGQAIGEFQKGRKEIEREIDELAGASDDSQTTELNSEDFSPVDNSE